MLLLPLQARAAVSQQIPCLLQIIIRSASSAATAAGAEHGKQAATEAPAAALQEGPGSVLQQRYAAMVASGVLRPDQHQQQLIGQLAGLLEQLKSYSSRVHEYRAATAAYQATYQQRLSELEALDQQRQAQEQQQQQQAHAASPGSSSSGSSGGGWFTQLLSNLTGSSSSCAAGAPRKELTPQQKARRAAAARQAQARQELGPGPLPPAAPQGLYVYGSVGSGKSLLMDLFYDTARQQLQLDHSRRMHFNAAMLELHSRLHHLDLQREQRQLRRRQQEEARANALAAAAAAASTASAASAAAAEGAGKAAGHATVLPAAPPEQAATFPTATPSAAAAAAAADSEAAASDTEEAEAELHAAAESEGDGFDDDAASDRQVSAWFDDAQWQQKEAKAAVLAIRKHLRASRAGRVPVAQLAAANAAVMSAAASSFIRAPGPDPRSGWVAAGASSSSSGGGERMAALLCFDEMQVGDVFSAAALKALLEALTAQGCVVVTTSNRHPADLPRHGLHEAMFGHFLNMLFSSCRLFELSSAADYRRLSLNTAATQLLLQPMAPSTLQSSSSSSGTGSSSGDVSSSTSSTGSSYISNSSSSSSGNSSDAASRQYFWPLGAAADAAMHHKWQQHLQVCRSSSSSNTSRDAISAQTSSSSSTSIGASTGDGSSGSSSEGGSSGSSSTYVPVMFGRTLAVPRAAGGAAWFDFDELCGRPLGSADYLALAQHYHTLFLSGVPAMSFANRDKARRFISLVDELYNGRVALVCSAALPPDQLFSDGQGETPLLDLEGLQFEGAVEGSKLRTDLMSDGGVAPVVSNTQAAAEAAALLGGAEEKFAFARAASRLYEMQSPLFLSARARQ